MLTRTENKQIKFHMVTREDMVPENHFVRKLERVVDFSFIYEEVSGYTAKITDGRVSIQ